MNAYVARVYADLETRNGHEKEFLQATKEVLEALSPVFDKHPEYEDKGLLERFVEPDRAIIFRVPWIDDQGKVQVNRGYRVQYNNAIGPYKGKSDNEVMRFCQSFMTELFKYIGKDTDVPAGDIGVGAREIGFLYGQYKRITGLYEGVLTGKGLSYGGSLARKEATGFGLCYLTNAMLKKHGIEVAGKRVVVSGSGNVAIYAAQKITQMGGKVVAMSDSNGYVVDENGINLDVVKQIKEVERGRIREYAARVPGATYTEGFRGIWTVKCDIALPCATQNELDEDGAKALIANGVIAVAEGANMPTTYEATLALQKAGVLFAPGKAANAGGVATSALEMSQNSQRLSWTFDEVDAKLKGIMENIFAAIDSAAEEYDAKDNYVVGANIAGFLKVADAMLAHGCV